MKKKMLTTYKYVWDHNGVMVERHKRVVQKFNLDRETGQKIVFCTSCNHMTPVGLNCRVCGARMFR